VIRLEEGTAKRVRVIGSLEGPALRLLAQAVSEGPVILDLSEVNQADEGGVRLLAGLPPERCALAGCPTWLSLWLERVRQAPQGR
jgi:ABC-type transporter Mla MlaB component